MAVTTAAPIVAGLCNAHVVPTAFVKIGDRPGVEDVYGVFKAIGIKYVFLLPKLRHPSQPGPLGCF